METILLSRLCVRATLARKHSTTQQPVHRCTRSNQNVWCSMAPHRIVRSSSLVARYSIPFFDGLECCRVVNTYTYLLLYYLQLGSMSATAGYLTTAVNAIHTITHLQLLRSEYASAKQWNGRSNSSHKMTPLHSRRAAITARGLDSYALTSSMHMYCY
jgi:hypothetical protein